MFTLRNIEIPGQVTYDTTDAGRGGTWLEGKYAPKGWQGWELGA